MRLPSLLLVSLLFAAPAAANPAAGFKPASYKLDPAHASVTFKVHHLGLAFYTARFTKFDAALAFDPAKPEASKLDVTLDPTSIETDYPFPEKEDFDKKLATDPKWLDAGAHKTMTFKSTKIEMTGDDTAKVAGDLTLKGVTKPVTLDVKLAGALEAHPFTKNPALGFSATGDIKRSDFGVSEGAPFVADDVKLVIEAEFLAG